MTSSHPDIAVAFVRPKHDRNIGSIMRAAELFGVSDVVLVGSQLPLRAASDTAKSYRRIGSIVETFDELYTLFPSHHLVVVETPDVAQRAGYVSTPMHKARPADKELLVVGSENTGLTSRDIEHLVELWDTCEFRHIPAPHPWSHNVATAAAIALYENYFSRER